jgi:hypothetical protein
MKIHGNLITLVIFGLFTLGCDRDECFNWIVIDGDCPDCTDDDDIRDDDSADDDTADDDSVADDDGADDDTTGDDDDTVPNPCPNPEEQIWIPGGTYTFQAFEIKNLEYIPQLNPEGELMLSGLTCAETCAFPECGADWVGQHDTNDDGWTYRMIDHIDQHMYSLTGRRLCTTTEFRAAASLNNHPPYGYSDIYDAGACDASMNPEYPIGEFDSCVSALGLRDVTQRAYWSVVDQQTADNYNAWAQDHNWHCVGEHNDQEAQVEEGWLVVAGGTNDRCTESFYGCFVNSMHWHAIDECDPYTYGNWDNEFDDDALRLCVDIDNPPSSEQNEFYEQIRDDCADSDNCRDVLLEALGWFNQAPIPPPTQPGFHRHRL